MLHLSSTTRQEWVDLVCSDVPTLLLDHAHCEKKAASTAMNLIFRYSDKPWLVKQMSALAREELEHFELCIERLEAMGCAFDRLEPSTYARDLLKAARTTEPARLVDTLLCCALIEARSCERMKLLSENLEDADLAAFYKGLLASEARHFQTYVDLAQRLAPRDEVRQRLEVLSRHEAEVLNAPVAHVRMHA